MPSKATSHLKQNKVFMIYLVILWTKPTLQLFEKKNVVTP